MADPTAAAEIGSIGTSARRQRALVLPRRADRRQLLIFVRQDSVIYRATSYTIATVEVGQGGPRAYALSTGLPLEFIPTSDPGQLHVGDTLHVRIVGDGKAVPNHGVFAGAAADTTSSAPVAASAGAANNSLRLAADGDGVLHLPLTNAGAWNLGAAYVYRRAGAASNEWTIARTTYVFHVAAAH